MKHEFFVCTSDYSNFSQDLSLFTISLFFLLVIKGSYCISMAQDTNGADLHQKKPVLLKDQVRLVKRKDSDRYEVVPIQDPLSFEKGFFVVIRACQLLAQKNDGIILIGLAGPSGAGKTVFSEKILNFMPSIGLISMDNYNDSSRIVDGNFDGNICSTNFCVHLKIDFCLLGFHL